MTLSSHTAAVSHLSLSQVYIIHFEPSNIYMCAILQWPVILAYLTSTDSQMYSKRIGYTDFTMTLLGRFSLLATSSLVSLLCSHHCAFPTLKKQGAFKALKAAAAFTARWRY